jgi:multiple sugar transport system permease protein
VQQAFERFNMGYATAISLVLFLMLVVVSLIQMRIMRANESDY